MSETEDPGPVESETKTGGSPKTPTAKMRLTGWIWLTVVYFVTCLMAIKIIPAYDKMFKEMDLGRLPILTEVILTPFRYGLYDPFPLSVLFAILTTIHFSWAGRTYRRLIWFDWSVTFALLVFITLVSFGLFLPFDVIMERIGR